MNEKLPICVRHEISKLKLPKNSTPPKPFVFKRAEVAGFGYEWIEIVEDPETGEIVEAKGDSSYRLKFAEALILSNDMFKTYHDNTLTLSHMSAKVLQQYGIDSGVCWVSSFSIYYLFMVDSPNK